MKIPLPMILLLRNCQNCFCLLRCCMMTNRFCYKSCCSLYMNRCSADGCSAGCSFAAVSHCRPAGFWKACGLHCLHCSCCPYLQVFLRLHYPCLHYCMKSLNVSCHNIHPLQVCRVQDDTRDLLQGHVRAMVHIQDDVPDPTMDHTSDCAMPNEACSTKGLTNGRTSGCTMDYTNMNANASLEYSNATLGHTTINQHPTSKAPQNLCLQCKLANQISSNVLHSSPHHP